MRARIAVHPLDGAATTPAPVGYLDTIGLQFSRRVGGAGDIAFEALMSDIVDLGAWDCNVIVEVEWQPGRWAKTAGFGIRHSYSHRGGFRRFQLRGTGLLEAIASETILLPEHAGGGVVRRSGDGRGLGWMNTAYDHRSDPDEPWDACYDTSRAEFPRGWPVESGAKWMNASGGSVDREGKFFRTTITIPGPDARYVRWWLSSDESATLWVGGERIIDTDNVEVGWKEYSRRKTILHPGTYAIAIYTATHWSKGGDGIDPVACVGAILDDDGQPQTWLVPSGAARWAACRRDDEPPGDVPPGPTPGQVIADLVAEARSRLASVWNQVRLDFSATHDSWGQPWAAPLPERFFPYGETYWDIFQSLGEADDVDVWMDGFTLRAAPRQGHSLPLTFTEEHFASFNTAGTPGAGTWVAARALDGWFDRAVPGYRREFAMPLGQAITRQVGSRIARAALRDRYRWDAPGCKMNPPQPGWVPLVDFSVGDSMRVDWQAIDHEVMVTGIAARAGEGGLLWEVDFTEWPPDVDVTAGSSHTRTLHLPHHQEAAAP